jgi:tRNA A37 threonylcarbamoyladenosine dehydratase
MGEEVVFVDLSSIPERAVIRTIYKSQLLELAEIYNPSVSMTEISSIADSLSQTLLPVYVYYPWRNEVLETVPEKEFIEIKTNRNKLLITSEEQEKLYYETTVSIAGMSVGSSILYGLVGTGIAKRFVIADDDVFSNSNLNRVQATVFDIGESKVKTAYRRAMEMNPFLDIKVIDQRITSDTINEFLCSGDIALVFEEIDDFKMKLLIREKAKHYKKPFIMLTNLGDSVQIDIERYDTNSAQEPFHGLVAEDVLSNIREMDTVDRETVKKLSLSLVEKTLVPERALQSLQELGSTLAGRPQLYSTVALDGGIAPFLARKIIIENSKIFGRYTIGLEGMKKL